MVTVPRAPPTRERQREHDRAHGVWQALVPDPAAAYRNSQDKPMFDGKLSSAPSRYVPHRDPITGKYVRNVKYKVRYPRVKKRTSWARKKLKVSKASPDQ